MHPGRYYKGERRSRGRGAAEGENNSSNVGAVPLDNRPSFSRQGNFRGSGRRGNSSSFNPPYGREMHQGAAGPFFASGAVPQQQPNFSQQLRWGNETKRVVDKDDVSTWTRKEFHQIVKAFVENKDTIELVFPSTLTAFQRSLVHKIAASFRLDHASSGSGEDRVLKLTKIAGILDAIKRQENSATEGLRVKTIEGYQGAQPLSFDHLSDIDIRSTCEQLNPFQRTMKKEIKLIADQPFKKPRRFNAHQSGLPLAPKTKNNADISTMLEFRRKLPAYLHASHIIETVRNNDVIVISGDTGCGKTTQVPQLLYDSHIFDRSTSIICTQPRRISALSVAQRVAQERGEACGDSCGYVIRFENVTSPNTRIIYQTTGILLRRLHTEPELRGVACIIVDEVHERDVETDFALLLLRDRIRAQQAHPGKYPLRLKLVVMSATVQIEALLLYFKGCNSGRDVPLLSIPGTLFPVDEYYLEDALQWLGLPLTAAPAMALVTDAQSIPAAPEVRNDPSDQNGKLYESLKSSVFDTASRDVESLISYDFVSKLILHIHSVSKSLKESILVFLPGWSAISQIARRLRISSAAREFSILMLHSSLTTAEQQRVFERPPARYRKVVLATSIAETSITIDDIVFVIDSGLAKGTSYDPLGNTSALTATLIGKANGVQRRGRAGRCQKGICIHLLPRDVYRQLPEFLPPEIIRTPLEEVCLQLKAIESSEKCATVLARAMDSPPAESVEFAVEFLTDMGALTEEDERLTNLGHALAELPTHPLLGKMLFTAACFGVLDTVATIAASLSVKSVFVRPQPNEKNAARENLLSFDDGGLSDHLSSVALLKNWIQNNRSAYYASEHFADATTLRSLERTKKQFENLILRSSFTKGIDSPATYLSRYSNNKGLVRLAIVWSLYPRIASIEYRSVRHSNVPQVLCWDNKSAVLSPNSVLSFYKHRDLQSNSFVVYYDRMNLEAQLNIFDGTCVSPIEIILCLRQLTVRPLVDIPKIFLYDTECRYSPPISFDVDSIEDPAQYGAMFCDGDRKLFIGQKNAVSLLQNARACMDFFLAISVKNVRVSRFPDELVRILARVVGHPVPELSEVKPTAVFCDPAVHSVKVPPGHLPAFVRHKAPAEDISDYSDSDAPVVEDEDVGVELDLTSHQKTNVVAVLGDLAVFRVHAADNLLDAAMEFEKSGKATAVVPPTTILEDVNGNDGGDEEDEEDDEEESTSDEDVILGNLNLNDLSFDGHE